jgi:hypothetical protein
VLRRPGRPGCRTGGAVSVYSLRGGDRGDLLLDPGCAMVYLAGEVVDLGEQDPG